MHKFTSRNVRPIHYVNLYANTFLKAFTVSNNAVIKLDKCYSYCFFFINRLLCFSIFSFHVLHLFQNFVKWKLLPTVWKPLLTTSIVRFLQSFCCICFVFVVLFFHFLFKIRSTFLQGALKPHICNCKVMSSVLAFYNVNWKLLFFSVFISCKFS